MRVVVTGSRGFKSYNTVESALGEMWQFDGDIWVAHGACFTGADRLANTAAKSLGMVVTTFPAEWNRLGKSAGIQRNILMIEQFNPDLVLAFWDGVSKGTLHCFTYAINRGIPVRIYPDES